MAVKWAGKTAISEQPDSPKYEFGHFTTCVRRFKGPIGLLLKERPSRGDEMDGFGDLTVEKVAIDATEGGMGFMTIYADNSVDTGDGGSSDSDKPQYEVEWTLLEKPLENHTNYAAMTNDDRLAVMLWEEEPDGAARMAFGYYETEEDRQNDANLQTLTGSGRDMAELKLKGIETFMLFYPICRRVTKVRVRVQTETCGVRNNPPAECLAPAGYQWLKTADRYTREGNTGKWERTEEWSGMTAWEISLYS